MASESEKGVSAKESWSHTEVPCTRVPRDGGEKEHISLNSMEILFKYHSKG
jgi:hypothetical protein